MIPRYEVQDQSLIWSVENRFKKFLEVEIALLHALEDNGTIPQNTSEAFKNVEIRPSRIEEIENITKHDVIAFCSSITEQVPAEFARFFHFGVTSSDVLDTALSLQLRDSMKILVTDIQKLSKALLGKIEKTKSLLSMGRSHGMYAEPMIFAQKFLSFYQELNRRLKDYHTALETEITGQLSGAVGNYTILDPEVERKALKLLGLNPEPLSTQVIPRDHLAKIISIGVLLASTLERMSVEFRLLQHSDVAEMHEGFRPGQKGSSTMPHKKNPISSENITGLSRIIRSHSDIALENCVLWHERDISHSSAERLYLPDHFGLLSYALRRMEDVVLHLVIDQEKIEMKVQQGFSAISSYILHEMILLNSVTREEIYSLVQEASFRSKTSTEFNENIKELAQKKSLDLPELLGPAELKAHYIKRFQAVLDRAKIKFNGV